MTGFELLVSLAKVALVLGALVFGLRVVSKQNRRGGRPVGTARRNVVEVVDQARIGRNASAVAVRAGDRVLVLGVSEQGVSTLADVTDAIDLTEPEGDEQSSVYEHAIDLIRSGGFRR